MRVRETQLVSRSVGLLFDRTDGWTDGWAGRQADRQ